MSSRMLRWACENARWQCLLPLELYGHSPDMAGEQIRAIIRTTLVELACTAHASPRSFGQVMMLRMAPLEYGATNTSEVLVSDPRLMIAESVGVSSQAVLAVGQASKTFFRASGPDLPIG